MRDHNRVATAIKGQKSISTSFQARKHPLSLSKYTIVSQNFMTSFMNDLQPFVDLQLQQLPQEQELPGAGAGAKA